MFWPFIHTKWAFIAVVPNFENKQMDYDVPWKASVSCWVDEPDCGVMYLHIYDLQKGDDFALQPYQ